MTGVRRSVHAVNLGTADSVAAGARLGICGPMVDRFVEAQEKSYAGALAELRLGAKCGHWIWWVFPQMRGLGTSERSLLYGIADEAEALAYLRHPVLGLRYSECVEVAHLQICLNHVPPLKLMGSRVDVLKLRSSLELFSRVSAGRSDFQGLHAHAAHILAFLKDGLA